ncbi:MAG: 7-cyano-7-deazaguanine synthase [Acidobacteriota bacterium]
MSDGRVAALASGGLDSGVMLVELTKTHQQVCPLYVRCGLFWEEVEKTFLQAFLKKLGHPRIQPLRELHFSMGDLYRDRWYSNGKEIPGYHDPDEAWEIPGRNIFLTTKAALWCKVHGVGQMALGSLASNPFRDATPEFFTLLQRVLTLGLDTRLQILRPLAHLGKREVIRRGRGLPLELTLSCANPVGKSHCGECGKCAERIGGFLKAGVPDPTDYAVRLA